MDTEKVLSVVPKQLAAEKVVQQSAAKKVVPSIPKAVAKLATIPKQSAAEIVTSVRLKQSTVERLKVLGRKGNSYDDIVCWLLEHSKKRRLP